MKELTDAVHAVLSSVYEVSGIVLFCALVAAVRFAVVRLSKES